MNIVVSNTYDELSKNAADGLIKLIRSVNQPLICTASGDSPAGLYKELVRRDKRKEIDMHSCKYVGLDEWAGMNGDDEGSCRYHLNKQFFHPLQINEQNICFFNGKAKDLKNECDSTEQFIRNHGGIDILILGLGMNGHIGMNEPGTSPHLRSHVAAIAAMTQEIGQKYFTTQRSLTHGLTIGPATIMDSKHIMLIVSGAKKAMIIQRVIEGPVSSQIPATILRHHPDCSVYLDQEAARLISKQ